MSVALKKKLLKNPQKKNQEDLHNVKVVVAAIVVHPIANLSVEMKANVTNKNAARKKIHPRVELKKLPKQMPNQKSHKKPRVRIQLINQ